MSYRWASGVFSGNQELTPFGYTLQQVRDIIPEMVDEMDAATRTLYSNSRVESGLMLAALQNTIERLDRVEQQISVNATAICREVMTGIGRRLDAAGIPHIQN